jgi:DNA-binding FadR family transcriptional regulator
LVKPIDQPESIELEQGCAFNATRRSGKRHQGLVMPIEAIEPRRLYRQVADQLRRLIDSGEFTVGGRLPAERELSIQLGVSRPTVREALIALEVDGRVRIRVGSGIYVLPAVAAKTGTGQPDSTMAGPFEILQARALIEGAVAEHAARIVTPAAIAELDQVLNGMRNTAHPGAQSIGLDRAFHVAIASMLGNDAVTKVVADLFDQRINPYFARLASYFESADSWQAALSEHAALRDRLAAGDAIGAKAAMQAHLQQSQIRFSETFGEVHPDPPKRTVVRQPARRRTRAAMTAQTSLETTKPRRTEP